MRITEHHIFIGDIPAGTNQAAVKQYVKDVLRMAQANYNNDNKPFLVSVQYEWAGQIIRHSNRETG